MNWEFLLGLLLPAYGVGYVWLIKTAREDTALYTLVAKHLKGLLITAAVSVPMLAFMFAFLTDEPAQIRIDAVLLAMIVFMLILVTLWSLRFFKRITELPAKAIDIQRKP